MMFAKKGTKVYGLFFEKVEIENFVTRHVEAYGKLFCMDCASQFDHLPSGHLIDEDFRTKKEDSIWVCDKCLKPINERSKSIMIDDVNSVEMKN
jgi:hypothetical protein